ncbi:MAG: hypothetical protein MJ147_03540 [Clostridia bacterium]|nr:hypothetical protein [Clostridia bacterium]
MANSYENTKMPEKPEVKIKPDAIPVDDKGQPLPDPTENLSNYIAPKGVEELKKSYSEIEVDEDVRETMEPPQRANFLRKHKPGKRGYDYYGTPSGSIPNDNNGLKPSPLTELFSAAEALEPEFDVNDIRDHVLAKEPIPGSEFKVVETPKLDRTDIKDDLKDKSDKKELQRTEVKKDPNAPKFLELYKESTNTKVIYQYDEAEMEDAPSKPATDTEEFFAEHSRVAKAKKKNSKKEEKKALKAALKAEKRRAKELRKAAKKNGKNNAVPLTDPKEIMELQPANAHKAENISAEEIAKRAALEAEKKLMAEKKQFISQLKKERLAAEKAAEDARLAREETEKLKAELEKMKEAAEKALAQKQEAEEAFRLARKENKRLDEEIKRQKKEN